MPLEMIIWSYFSVQANVGKIAFVTEDLKKKTASTATNTN